MIGHLNESALYEYIRHGEKNLSDPQLIHLKECDYCRNRIEQQKNIDSFLTGWKPIKAPDYIYNKVINQIKPSSARKFDLLFYTMLTALFLFALVLFFSDSDESGKTLTYRKDQVVDFVENKVSLDEIHVLDNINRLYDNFMNYILNFAGGNSNVRIAIFAFIGLIFYLFIDHSILRRKFR